MQYRIAVNQLKAGDFSRLFSGAGWGDPPAELCEISLKNSWATFSVLDGEHTIAMARLIGDGGMAFFLKDFVVQPEYQRQGIGRELLTYIQDYILSQMKEGWFALLELTSAKGKAGFYRKMGFRENPNADSDAGFTKRLEK